MMLMWRGASMLCVALTWIIGALIRLRFWVGLAGGECVAEGASAHQGISVLLVW